MRAGTSLGFATFLCFSAWAPSFAENGGPILLAQADDEPTTSVTTVGKDNKVSHKVFNSNGSAFKPIGKKKRGAAAAAAAGQEVPNSGRQMVPVIPAIKVPEKEGKHPNFSLSTPRLPDELTGEPPPDIFGNMDTVLKVVKHGNSNYDLRTVGDLMIFYRRRVTDSPSDPNLRQKLGAYLYVAGDYEAAATEIKRAIALKPTDHVSHTLLACILDAVGDHEAAIAEFRRAIDLAPNWPDAHILLADSLEYRGDLSEAINEYRRANTIRPTAAGFSGLADALLGARDTIGAVKAARQAVSLEPSSASAHVSLTRALLVTGDSTSAAVRTARQAVLLNPMSAASHTALGRALHSKGDLNGAVEEFKQAVSLDPLDAQARNDYGYALYGKGDVFSALAELRLALRLNPHLSEARNNLEIAIHRLAAGNKTTAENK